MESPDYETILQDRNSPRPTKRLPPSAMQNQCDDMMFEIVFSEPPQDVSEHLDAGKAISLGWKVTTLDGTAITNSRDCYLSAVATHQLPQRPEAFYRLGCSMTPTETVTARGLAVTKKDCLQNACEGNFYEALVEVALLMDEDDKLSVVYAECSREILLYTATAFLDDAGKAEAYCFLGEMMRDDSMALWSAYDRSFTWRDWQFRRNSETTVTRSECFKQALCFNRCHARTYVALGKWLKGSETVTLADGTVLSSRECLTLAIHHNPYSTAAYEGLGERLNAGETATLLDGSVVSARDCFVRAIELDPENKNAYLQLGIILDTTNTSQVFYDGTVMTSPQCLLYTLEFPTPAEVYYRLGKLFAGRSSSRGQSFLRQLYVSALMLNPKHSNAYNDLGLELHYNEFIMIRDCKLLSKRDCFILALKYDRDNASAWCNLGLAMTANEPPLHFEAELDLPPVRRRDCFVQSLQRNPHNSKVYLNLGACLNGQETVELSGQQLTQRDCYLRAIDIDPGDPVGYRKLAMNMAAEGVESITMLDGQQLTQRQLYLEATLKGHQLQEGATS